MFFVKVLYIFAPFVCCNCNSHRVYDVMTNTNIVSLINSYIKPLSEKFPNHELEVQLEIQGPPLHHISRSVSRRKVHLRKPTFMLRDANEGNVPQGGKPKPAIKSTLPPASTYALATRTAPTVSTTARVEKHTTPKKEPSKEPVYKDELQKALDDLEKKINKNISKGPSGDQEPQLVVSNTGPVTGGSNTNINRIIELIRKGVHFQRHVPNTEDGNMDWMQIKIPKSLNNDKKQQK